MCQPERRNHSVSRAAAAKPGVVSDAALTVRDEMGDVLFSLPVEEIRRAWRGHLEEADNEREGVA